jgi:hypothetical protein
LQKEQIILNRVVQPVIEIIVRWALKHATLATVGLDFRFDGEALHIVA